MIQRPGPPAPTALRPEHRSDLVARRDGAAVFDCPSPTPRLSWRLETVPEGWQQVGADVEVCTPSSPGHAVHYAVEAPHGVLVPWPGEPLPDGGRARVRVRVRGRTSTGEATTSDWSAPLRLERQPGPPQWIARFIAPVGIGGRGEPAPCLETEFSLGQGVVAARLHLSAHGAVVATLNGQRVGSEVLAPGWTAYKHRLRVRTHDVTDLVALGHNHVQLLLGNGWWRGRLGFRGEGALYGERLAGFAQLEVEHEDGSRTTVATDGSWTARESGVLADDIYDGQRTDLGHACQARRPSAVEVVDQDLSHLIAPEGPPVRVTERRGVASVTRLGDERHLIDVGQNVVGWLRITPRAAGEPGAEVVVQHAEVLTDGELCTEPLRSAAATDSYLRSGAEGDVLEPELTFHGFRYAVVTGLSALTPEEVSAAVVGTDLDRRGWFSCSDPEVNRLHENVLWSLRGNFLDIPTDCPQRDERLGWTGDIQVFAPTALHLADCAGFLRSWLADLQAEQHADGSIPFVVPNALREPPIAAAAWGDAAVIVPWTIYERTGDVEVLERQWESMVAWVDCLSDRAGPDGVWRGGFQFGDWLDPAAPPEDAAAATTHPDVLATACLARCATVLARAAETLGRESEAMRLRALSRRVREGFRSEFTTAGGRVVSDSATAYAMAICWDLLTPDQLVGAGRRLADLVRVRGARVSTGFVGTPLVTDALCLTGSAALAGRMIRQRECPSWLYPVTQGATTIWERWDSLRPDGSVNSDGMTSFNHYALGAVADWMHRRVAGLAPIAPGYAEIRVEPLVEAGFTSASSVHESPFGRIEVAWEIADRTGRLRISLPYAVSALVRVPGTATDQRVGCGEHTFTWQPPRPHRTPRTVRDVFDDEPRWSALVAQAAACGCLAAESEAARRIAAHLDAPAEQIGQILVGDPFDLDRWAGLLADVDRIVGG